MDETCIKYASSDPLAKRDSVEALVANSTGEACFGGLIACNVVNDVTANGSGNMTCPYVCDGTSCTILDASSSVSDRRSPVNACITQPCITTVNGSPTRISKIWTLQLRQRCHTTRHWVRFSNPLRCDSFHDSHADSRQQVSVAISRTILINMPVCGRRATWVIPGCV